MKAESNSTGVAGDGADGVAASAHAV